MRRWMLAAAAIAVLPFAPALADWAPAKWGMSPEQVIAAVPGARVLPQNDEQNLRGRHALVEAPGAVGTYAVTARYYFLPDRQVLDMVNLTVNDRTNCAAFRDSLTQRHGAGERKDETGSRDGTNYETTTIEWASGRSDRLTYHDMHIGERFGICKLIVQKR